MDLFRRPRSAAWLVLAIVIAHLAYAPVSDIVCAQVTEDNAAPVIVHLPIKTAIRGQVIPVVARIGDDSQVGNVTLNFKKGGRFLDVPLPMRKTVESETIKIRVVSEAAYVFSGPGMWHDTLATVTEDEVFETFEEEREHGFYHMRLSDEVDAWLSYADAEPVATGGIYAGAIPPDVTFAPEVVYRIAAEDIHHNKISTLPHTIRIEGPEREAKNTKEPPDEVEQTQAAPKGGRPFYKSWWFLGGVAAAGATAAVVVGSSRKGEEDKKGAVHVLVDW